MEVINKKSDFLLRVLIFVYSVGWIVACSGPQDEDLVRREEPGYTGLERCASCHTNNYAEWKKSLHSQAMAVPADSTIVGDFDNAQHSYGGVTSRMFWENENAFMETVGADGQLQTYRIDYTIGVRQHQAYLTQFPKGRYQVLPLYHDGKTKRWVDAQEGKVVEHPGPLSQDDFYFWTNRGRTWNYHCFDCHASRVEKNYDLNSDSYRTTVGSLTIDCEACHGPSQRHDETRGTPDSMHLVDLKALSAEQSVEVCAQCHAAKEVIASGYLPGEPFYDFNHLVLPDESFFWPDGQPKVYLYPVILHMMSPCYLEGGLTCTGCHDAHGTDLPVDLIAKKDGMGLCEECHLEIAADPVSHTHHREGSIGLQCVSCHMPYHQVTGEEMTDHRIVSPVPENTVEFGLPNACNQAGCHADKSASWASEWSQNWYGNYQQEEVNRVQAFSWGRQGDARAIQPLIQILQDRSEGMVWRATAATLLGRIGDVKALKALISGLNNDHPMVRIRSAVALGRLGDLRGFPALLVALSDSIRSVRIFSAFALMDAGYLPDNSTAGALFAKAFEIHKKMVMGVQGDDPGLHESLGEVYERQGRYEEAMREMEIVARLDPGHTETVADLKRLKEKVHNFNKVGAVLKGAVEIRPKDTQSRARWGTFLFQNGFYDQAVKILKGVSDSIGSEILYVTMGDAYRGIGDREGAISSYRRALEVNPETLAGIQGLAKIAFSAVEKEMDIQKESKPEEENDLVWILRGADQAVIGDFQAARRAFSRALEMEVEEVPMDTFGLSRQAQLVRQGLSKKAFDSGMTAYQEGRSEVSKKAFILALQWDPRSMEAYLMLGLILADSGDLERAEKELFSALLLNPANASAYVILGTVYQERGNFEKAMMTYRQALALDSKVPSTEVYMSQIYFQQEKWDSAQVVLKRVLKREPDNTMAREVLLRQENKMKGGK